MCLEWEWCDESCALEAAGRTTLQVGEGSAHHIPKPSLGQPFWFPPLPYVIWF